MKVAAILVAVLALVVMASAYQRAFYGGSFKQANGLYSPGFAAYDANHKGWRAVPPPGIFEGVIYDIAPVGENGVFAVGDFVSINNQVPSFGVAFFDGHKWCAVRHGLAASSEQSNWASAGRGTAVWCNNGTSCYVAGEFAFIENQPDNAPNNPSNFAHFIRDAETGEWVFDSSITEWNNPTLTGPVFFAPPNSVTGGGFFAIPGTLQGVPANDPEYFFMGVGNDVTDYGTDMVSIWRGGRQDGGWLLYLDASGVFGTGTIRGFDVDDDSTSPGVYVVSNSNSNSDMAKKSTVILRPCNSGTCPGGVVTQTSEWVSLVPSTPLLTNLYDVVAVNASTRYYIGEYTPGSGYSSRVVALKQDGFSSPVPLGAPFSRDTSIELVRIDLFEGDKPFVIGSFRTANLYYPADTDDNAGVVREDIRELDSVHYVAIYENGQWNAHFGGGLSPDTETGVPDNFFARSLVLKHNAQSNVWYFANPFITFVHNVKAEGLAYFDDSEDLNHKNIYALFTRRITRRSTSFVAESTVYDIACETEDCAWVYAGGDFGFHGPDTLGAIAKVEVRRDNPTVMSVGGGLWYTDDNVVPTDADLQFSPGWVYALRVRGDFVYAGGWFSRGKNGYVCLSHLARIHHSDSESGNWESLGGGCDDSVYDLHFWGDDLYVAGEFVKCGSNVVNYVTAYRSGEFRSLNNGLDGTGYSLEYFQGRMIVGGDFGHAGGLPVSGVAAWDGNKWRALQAACTDDCVPGELPFYFGQTVAEPEAVVDLRASKDGTVLYARAQFNNAPGFLLAQWQYFDQSDNGKWTAKGALVAFDLTDAPLGDAILNNGTQLVVAGVLGNSPSHTHQGLSVHAYSLELENWVDNDIIFEGIVEVVRSSASTLDSWISYF